jgi:hypothetical protein
VAFPVAEWRLLEARIDYWSGTTEDHRIGDEAYERAREYVEGDRLGDMSGSGQSVQGYFGVASEHTFGGQSPSGTFVRISSSDAGARWFDFFSRGLRTSRIDLCCTLSAGRDVPNVAYSIRYDPRLPNRKRGRSPELALYSSNVSGDLVYVGSERSDGRGRVYDKARESKGAYQMGAWRWEVQSRHALGNNLATTLAARESAPEWISAFVRGWFLDRGINAPWQTEIDGRLPPLPAPQTTDAKRLAWLKTSVAPMVERMKCRYTLNELRGALGLLYRVSERTHTRITR